MNVSRALELLTRGFEAMNNPDKAARPGCFGTLAFSEDAKCKSCSEYEPCRSVDRSNCYLVLEEEISHWGHMANLEKELKEHLGDSGLVSSRKTEVVSEKPKARKVERPGRHDNVPGKPRAPKKADSLGTVNYAKVIGSVPASLDFDPQDALAQFLVEKPATYKGGFEVFARMSADPKKIMGSLSVFYGKVLRELAAQGVIAWTMRDKENIGWNL